MQTDGLKPTLAATISLSLILLTPLLHPFNCLFSRTTWVSRYQKGKVSLDLNEARDDEVLGCSGMSWTICKQSAPRSRQMTTPTPHYSEIGSSPLKGSEGTVGLAESNGSLPPGLWLTSPAGWLPRTRISSGTLRSVIEYGLPFLHCHSMFTGRMPFLPPHQQCHNTEGTMRWCYTIYDTRCYFNVRSKADMSRLNLPHGNDT